MPVIQRCQRLHAALGRAYYEGWNKVRNSALGKMIEPRVGEASKWIAHLSPSGAEFARELEEVAFLRERGRGRLVDTLDQWGKKTSRADREAAAKVARGRLKQADVTPAQWELGQRLRNELLDPIMNAAAAIPGSYRIVNGRRLPIRGSGRAYPQILNAKGIAFLEEAVAKGVRSPRVVAWAEDMVKQGKAANVEAALAQLNEMHDARMRRANPYLERQVKVELPDEFIEWDPFVALPDWLDQQALMIEGARKWGWNLPRARALIERIGAETRDNGVKKTIEQYVQSEFGVPSRYMKADRQVHSAIRQYERFRIFGGTFLGPARNAFQWVANGVDAPLSAHFSVWRKYPPVIQRFMKESDQLRREILRAGANPEEHPFTGFGTLHRGGKVSELIDRATIMQRISIRASNERAALLGKFSLEKNIDRLIQLQGNRGPLLKMWDRLRHLSVNPAAATERILKRQGIADPAELARKIQAGERLTLDEVEKAMALTTYSTQFGYTLASKPIMVHQHPLFQTIFFLKQWGFRQAEFIHDHVLKELALGNAKPMVKFLAATFMIGEVYNTARDVLTGSERSLTMNTLMNPNNNGAQATAFRIMRNIADGGGVAMLQDVLWGFGQFVGGPAGGTIENLGRGLQHIYSAPQGAKLEMTGRALVDFMDRELVLSNQWLGAMRRAHQVVTGENERYFQNLAVRQRSFEYLDTEAIRDEGWIPYLEEQALDVVRGRRAREPGEFTLAYETMAAAVNRGDIADAELVVRQIMSTVERRERNDVAQRFELAAQARSPLGPLTQEQRLEMLRTLPLAERQRVRRVQLDWERAANEAIRRARRNAR